MFQTVPVSIIRSFSLYIEPCSRGSVQGRRYVETSLLVCSFTVTFPPKVVVRRLAGMGSERFGGNFLIGLSSQGSSLIFWICWRHCLAGVGQPEESCLSWFFAVAERTFRYVSKSKLVFGLWILNSCFDLLLSILGICSVGNGSMS